MEISGLSAARGRSTSLTAALTSVKQPKEKSSHRCGYSESRYERAGGKNELPSGGPRRAGGHVGEMSISTLPKNELDAAK